MSPYQHEALSHVGTPSPVSGCQHGANRWASACIGSCSPPCYLQRGKTSQGTTSVNFHSSAATHRGQKPREEVTTELSAAFCPIPLNTLRKEKKTPQEITTERKVLCRRFWGRSGGRDGNEFLRSCCLIDRYHCSLKHTYLPDRSAALFHSLPEHCRLEEGRQDRKSEETPSYLASSTQLCDGRRWS